MKYLDWRRNAYQEALHTVEQQRLTIARADAQLDDMLYALSGGNVKDEPVPVMVIEDWILKIRKTLGIVEITDIRCD